MKYLSAIRPSRYGRVSSTRTDFALYLVPRLKEEAGSIIESQRSAKNDLQSCLRAGNVIDLWPEEGTMMGTTSLHAGGHQHMINGWMVFTVLIIQAKAMKDIARAVPGPRTDKKRRWS